MDDPNNNEENDASNAMQKARKQAQAQARNQAKLGNKKEKSLKKDAGAILHVNNYRNGIPEAKCKMSKNPNFPASLKPGYIVRSKGSPSGADNAFVVEAKLAARVYMVKNQKSDKYCALKIEPYYNEEDVKQLKRDVFILMDASKQDQRFSHHFPKLVSKGRVADHFNYLVTSLCDFNLDDLREKVIKNDFSVETAARLSMQAFQAVHDIHTLGYLHRNISPSKFMLGLENSTLIYLGGFSTAYHFKRKDGKESPSPKKLYKLSKTRFLPRAYHRFKDFTRFDDLESWLYTSIDFFGRKLLPWFDNMDESQIIAGKERLFFDAFEEIYSYVPKQIQVVQKYIDKNNDGDKPNYTFMGITLVGMRDKLKFPYNGPFDFQQGHGTHHGTHSKKSKHKKQATKEEKVPDDGEGGPAIAPPTSTATKKRKSKKRNDGPPLNAPNNEVFEEGEAEGPGGGENEKPALNADRALSMVRKKKPSKGGATAKAADMDIADQGPLKAVDPGVVKALKKKKAPPLLPPPPPEEEEDDENGNEAQPPPPPPIIKAKKPKPSKPKSKKKVEKPGSEKEAGGGEEEDGGGADEEKDDGNDTGTNTDNMKPDL